MYTLPKSAQLGEKEYEIRSHYADILEMVELLNDPELTDSQRGYGLLIMFYPDFETIPAELYGEAQRFCLWFISGGQSANNDKKALQLVAWDKDFPLIVAPINRVLGREIRDLPYLHWWTFLSAYQEIGDCTFAQVVRIREAKAKGKPLSKEDQKWYRENRKLVDIPTKYTSEELKILKTWGGGKSE